MDFSIFESWGLRHVIIVVPAVVHIYTRSKPSRSCHRKWAVPAVGRRPMTNESDVSEQELSGSWTRTIST